MMMKLVCGQVIPFVCLTAFGFLLAPLAESTSLAQLSLAELVNTAHAVVYAKAISNERLWHDGEIWTVTTFQVIENWKGNSPPELNVWMIGGQMGRIMSFVPGAPRFRPGEETVLFLESARGGEMSITAWGEGTFRVRFNTHTAESFVTQDTAIAPEYEPASHSFKHNGIRNWPLAVLKARVLEAAWGPGSTK